MTRRLPAACGDDQTDHQQCCDQLAHAAILWALEDSLDRKLARCRAGGGYWRYDEILIMADAIAGRVIAPTAAISSTELRRRAGGWGVVW